MAIKKVREISVQTLFDWSIQILFKGSFASPNFIVYNDFFLKKKFVACLKGLASISIKKKERGRKNEVNIFIKASERAICNISFGLMTTLIGNYRFE